MAIAIRSAERFLEALERMATLIAELKEQDADAYCEELDVLRSAVKQAPFVLRGDRVVAKGFVPRVVA